MFNQFTIYLNSYYLKFMAEKMIITIIVCLFTFTQQFQIQSIKHTDFTPQHSSDYSNYIKLIFGSNFETDTHSTELKKLISKQRFSVLNSINKLAIVFKDESQIVGEKQLSIDSQFLETLSQNSVLIVDMMGKNIDEVKEKIIQLKNNNFQVHELMGKSQQLKIIVQSMKQKPRLLMNSKQMVVNQSASLSPAYLIKFFFSILFIIVTLGALLSIANMENSRDTLLYAKFIADVAR